MTHQVRKENQPHVGLRLRTFRERQGWSLRSLAERCGLSINAISRIERGENSPTVSSLHRLALALSVPITDFFVDSSHEPAIFVRSQEGLSTQNVGYSVEHLGHGWIGKQLQPFLVTVEPGCESASHPVTHPGEEFVHCLNGQIEYCVDEQEYVLNQGDTLLFEASQTHFWRNRQNAPAMFLLIFQAAQDNTLARQRHQTG